MLTRLNGLLSKIGYCVLPLGAVGDMLTMICAYRAVLQTKLEPGQVIVWDKETRTIEVVSMN